MEFLIELLFEFIGEIVLQVVFEALAESGLQFFKREKAAAPPAPWKPVLGYALLGAVVGGISLLLVPNAFLQSRSLRIVNLIVTPIVSGAAMVLIGRLRARRGQPVPSIDRFAYGLTFAFAMAAVRFAWAH